MLTITPLIQKTGKTGLAPIQSVLKTETLTITSLTLLPINNYFK